MPLTAIGLRDGPAEVSQICIRPLVRALTPPARRYADRRSQACRTDIGHACVGLWRCGPGVRGWPPWQAQQTKHLFPNPDMSRLDIDVLAFRSLFVRPHCGRPGSRTAGARLSVVVPGNAAVLGMVDPSGGLVGGRLPDGLRPRLRVRRARPGRGVGGLRRARAGRGDETITVTGDALPCLVSPRGPEDPRERPP